jgi:hypothetical protein
MRNLNLYIEKGQMLVLPSHENLQYSGRIDFEVPEAPILIYPSSYVTFRFTGTFCKVILENKRIWWNNFLGFVIDGKQDKIELPNEGQVCLTLVDGLEDKEHTLLLFKRMDNCHTVKLHGFVLEEGAEVLKTEERPNRRIEVYGDSVSAGEVSEAIDYVGKADPEHQGEYSNSWYSYAWMAARKLKAEIHNVAQGGIALLDHTGWFAAPDLLGMENVYDKLQYNPGAGEIKPWNFTQYIPHVIIVAIGQNDSHPQDYMARDYNSVESKNWRNHYKSFIQKLRTIYPKAVIILTTTILRHDLAWDKSIEEVTQEMADDKVLHFIYSQNSVGTHGHIRIQEADKMSDELASFINSLGDEIWKD